MQQLIEMMREDNRENRELMKENTDTLKKFSDTFMLFMTQMFSM